MQSVCGLEWKAEQEANPGWM